MVEMVAVMGDGVAADCAACKTIGMSLLQHGPGVLALAQPHSASKGSESVEYASDFSYLSDSTN